MQWGFAVLTLKQRKEKQIKKVAENASCVLRHIGQQKGLFVYDQLCVYFWISVYHFFYILYKFTYKFIVVTKLEKNITKLITVTFALVLAPSDTTSSKHKAP